MCRRRSCGYWRKRRDDDFLQPWWRRHSFLPTDCVRERPLQVRRRVCASAMWQVRSSIGVSMPFVHQCSQGLLLVAKSEGWTQISGWQCGLCDFETREGGFLLDDPTYKQFLSFSELLREEPDAFVGSAAALLAVYNHTTSTEVTSSCSIILT